ncbi:MAG: hypothetical protein E7376_03955 [Clostridiales bacterium]|nr:hypothetical protein [Clostridiales bacterium]
MENKGKVVYDIVERQYIDSIPKQIGISFTTEEAAKEYIEKSYPKSTWNNYLIQPRPQVKVYTSFAEYEKQNAIQAKINELEIEKEQLTTDIALPFKITMHESHYSILSPTKHVTKELESIDFYWLKSIISCVNISMKYQKANNGKTDFSNEVFNISVDSFQQTDNDEILVVSYKQFVELVKLCSKIQTEYDELNKIQNNLKVCLQKQNNKDTGREC